MSVILICGANGSGKTTLGRLLAKEINFSFLNDEEYYFLDSDIPFSASRTDKDAKDYVLSYIDQHKDVVIVSSRGDLRQDINSLYDYVIYLSASKEIRLSRIEQRDKQRFGKRVLRGGDMYEQQMAFYEFVASRTPERIEKWLNTLDCKVFWLDGTKCLKDNIKYIKSQISTH
ncbi:MAG: AAA family ATPase [Clostridia bacterium]|nr:AAA family ATPase [Clostridia bacterium]